MEKIITSQRVKLIKERNLLRIVFCILLLFLTVCAVVPTFQNDTFYIIKLGERILDNGIDLSDPWAWSAPIINTYPHFLFNIILAVLYRLFGFYGIYVFVLFVGYIFALSLYYILEKLYDRVVGDNDDTLYPFVGMIVSGIVIIGFQWFIIARPQLLTYLFWLWEAWFVLKYLNTGKKRYGIAIVFIAWLCALVHATAWYFTFILFFPFFAAAYLTKLSKYLFSKGINVNSILLSEKYILSNDNECNNANKLWVYFFASFATGLITPTRLCYSSVFKAYSGSTIENINEHQHMVLADLKWVLAGILLFFVLFSVFRIKIRLDLLFLYGGTMLMAINSNRHVALFVFMGWFALFYLFFGAMKNIPSSIRKTVNHTIIPFLAILVIAVFGVNNSNTKIFNFYDSDFVSEEAIDFLKENYNVQDLKLFNEYHLGAYMLFRDIPVFIDSRVNEYTRPFNPDLERDVYDDYISIIDLKKNWREVEAYYDFDGYFISKSEALTEVLSVDSDYEKVWENNKLVIFMKVS